MKEHAESKKLGSIAGWRAIIRAMEVAIERAALCFSTTDIVASIWIINHVAIIVPPGDVDYPSLKSYSDVQKS